MKAIILIALVAFACSNRAVNKKFVEKLKKIAPFKVYDVDRNPYKDWTTEEIRNSLGLKVPHYPIHRKLPPSKYEGDSYDFREAWPECVLGVRDRGSCGADLHFSGAMALQQRFCQQSQNETKPILSPQDAISCDLGDMGCGGGWIDRLWEYLANSGLVDEDCFPYTSQGGEVEDCITKCKNEAPWKKYKVRDVEKHFLPDDIKSELEVNGPMESGFEVYTDFLNYEGGIYQHTEGVLEGGLAVVLIGYGKEGDINYWICQNSAGDKWGEEGYFRIKFGECGIDIDVYGGRAIL